MLTAITRSQLLVLDQDRALDFSVHTLGLEVAADIDFGIRDPFGNMIRIGQMSSAAGS